MGHWILSDEHLEACFAITHQAGMMFMSHCQDPEHTARLVRASRGRRVLLTHATAAGSGSHGDAVASLEQVLALAHTSPGVTLDFTTAHLRRARGLRDGILIDARAQAIARDAIAGGRCRLLTSDGPCNATMKGFGDARENIPCLLELAEEGVVSLGDSVAMMTCNPARFAAEATGQKWWTQELGHLGAGARANVVLVEPHARRAVMTLVEGRIAAFEGRCIRAAHGAGGWASRSGLRPRGGDGRQKRRLQHRAVREVHARLPRQPAAAAAGALLGVLLPWTGRHGRDELSTAEAAAGIGARGGRADQDDSGATG